MFEDTRFVSYIFQSPTQRNVRALELARLEIVRCSFFVLLSLVRRMQRVYVRSIFILFCDYAFVLLLSK